MNNDVAEKIERLRAFVCNGKTYNFYILGTIRLLLVGIINFRPFKKNFYDRKTAEQVSDWLKKIFPEEDTNNVLFLAEKIQSLHARSGAIATVEFEFYKNTFRLYPKDLDSLQRAFFDKYIAFLQGLYSTLNATMLFIDRSKSIEKNHIATGKSLRRFLKSRESYIDEQTFSLLYQAIVIRSLISEHIKDGKLDWWTSQMSGIFHENIKQSEEAKVWLQKNNTFIRHC